MLMCYWVVILFLVVGWGVFFFFYEILFRELGFLMVGFGCVGFGVLGCWIWFVGMKVMCGGNVRFGGVSFVVLVFFSVF